MSQATAQKPDAIVVFVADSTAIVPSLARAGAAGIPVMVVGTAVPDSALKYVTLMNLQDSTQLGTFAAQNLVEGMKKQGLTKGNVIALTGTSSQIDVQQRMAAFKSYLAKTPQFKLVAVQNANWDAVQSASLAKALFAKYASQGGIQGVYGMADYMAVGAINASEGRRAQGRHAERGPLHRQQLLDRRREGDEGRRALRRRDPVAEGRGGRRGEADRGGAERKGAGEEDDLQRRGALHAVEPRQVRGRMHVLRGQISR